MSIQFQWLSLFQLLSFPANSWQELWHCHDQSPLSQIIPCISEGWHRPTKWSFHSLESMEKVMSLGEKIKSRWVCCTEPSWLISSVKLRAPIGPAQSNSPSLAWQNSQKELITTSKGDFISTLGPKDPLSFITLCTSSIYSFNISKNRSSHINRLITFDNIGISTVSYFQNPPLQVYGLKRDCIISHVVFLQQRSSLNMLTVLYSFSFALIFF